MIKKLGAYSAGLALSLTLLTITLSTLNQAHPDKIMPKYSKTHFLDYIQSFNQKIKELKKPKKIDLQKLVNSPDSLSPSDVSRILASHHHAAHHKISRGGIVIFFTFVALMIGAIFTEIKKKFNIPYTPMILILGVFVGLYHDSIGVFGDSVEVVNGIDPHTLLMIFIPGLVFEGSYNTDGYTFSRSKWQVLIMAGPGVLLTAIIIAYSLVFLFGYQDRISVSEALVIGSIISTTDPVAVVALLKELGTSIKFNTLLEGESLLNDGTAFVFFLVCLDIIVNGSFEFWPTVFKFFRLSFGGPLFGIVVGMIASKWISKILRDNSLIVIITLFSTYLVFFISENYLEVSGILALVSLGIYLSQFTKVNLSHKNHHAVHTVWSFCGFVLETMIFLITGTYIGQQLLNYKEFAVEWSDVFKALIFFPFLNLVRYLVMLIQLPILNKVGYKISCTSAIVLTYGGLRGAIALSLAMIVAVDYRLNVKLRHLCLFYVVVTILSTVCVNGMTIKFLMRAIGFLKKDPIKQKMRNNIIIKMLIKTLEYGVELKKDKEFVGADWKTVDKLTHMRNYKVLEIMDKGKDDKKNPKSPGGFSNKSLNIALGTQKVLKKVSVPGIISHGNSRHMSPAKKRRLNGVFNSNLGTLKQRKSAIISRFSKSRESPSSVKRDLNGHQEAPDSDRKVLNRHQSGKQLPPQGSPGSPKKIVRKVAGRRGTFLGIIKPKKVNGEITDSKPPPEELKNIINDNLDKVNPEEIKRELRDRVYQLMKHHIHERQEKNLCRRDVVRSLKRLCDMCSDNLEMEICLREFSDYFLGKTMADKLLRRMVKIPLIGKLCLSYLTDKMFYNFQFITTLISSCQDINEQMTFMARSIGYEDEVEVVKKEIVFNITMAQKLKVSLLEHCEGLVCYMKTKMAAYSMVEYQRKQIGTYEHQGLLSEKEKDEWAIRFDKRIVEIDQYQPEIYEFVAKKEVMFKMEFPMFSSLGDEKINDILRLRTREEFGKGCNAFLQKN